MAKQTPEAPKDTPKKIDPPKEAPSPKPGDRIENALRVLADSHAKALPVDQAVEFTAQFEAALMS